MERYDVAHSGSVAFFPDSFGGAFAMNVSTLKRYIPNATVDSHLGKSNFTCGVSMVGAGFWSARINSISFIS